MNRKSHNRPNRRQDGFTLVEIMIAVVVILTLMAIALPSLWAAKAAAREAAAISALRSIASAQQMYAITYQQGYAPSLAALGPASRGTLPHAGAADLIDELLAAGERSGYTFKYEALDHNGDGLADSYTVTANPTGLHAQKYFYLDQTMAVRASAGAPANETPQHEPAFSSAIR